VWIVAGSLIGGMKKKSEKDRIRRGLNILVATPGRLCDHLDTTMALNLCKIEFLIFDEADRLYLSFKNYTLLKYNRKFFLNLI
jgi:ATP-dependent RNA helicase DDX31/DBP7